MAQQCLDCHMNLSSGVLTVLADACSALRGAPLNGNIISLQNALYQQRQRGREKERGGSKANNNRDLIRSSSCGTARHCSERQRGRRRNAWPGRGRTGRQDSNSLEDCWYKFQQQTVARWP